MGGIGGMLIGGEENVCMMEKLRRVGTLLRDAI